MDFSGYSKQFLLKAQVTSILKPAGLVYHSSDMSNNITTITALDKNKSIHKIRIPTTIAPTDLKWYLLRYYPELFV